MAGKIHVGPNGPGRCSVVPGGFRPCPYDPDRTGKNHYDTVQEAQAAYEAELESAHGLTPGFSKTPGYPYLPELPTGFEWEVKTRQFGNTRSTCTFLILWDKTEPEPRIVRDEMMTDMDNIVLQNVDESKVKGHASDWLERYDVRAAFRGEKPEPFSWQ